MQKDKHQKRLLQCIELAMERIKTRISIADLAKRHNLARYEPYVLSQASLPIPNTWSVTALAFDG